MKRHVLGLAVLLCASTACVTEQSRDLSGEGVACLDGATIKVDFQTCLSSSCDTLEGASCEAALSGDTIMVTSAATVVSDSGASACTADCGLATTSCAVTGGDASAATTISYAGSETTELGCTDPF